MTMMNSEPQAMTPDMSSSALSTKEELTKDTSGTTSPTVPTMTPQSPLSQKTTQDGPTIRKCQRASVYLLCTDDDEPCYSCAAWSNCKKEQKKLHDSVQELYMYDPEDGQLGYIGDIMIEGNSITLL